MKRKVIHIIFFIAALIFAVQFYSLFNATFWQSMLGIPFITLLGYAILAMIYTLGFDDD